MPRIANDKYYTPQEIAYHCIEILNQIVFEPNKKWERIIEPSVGSGAFLQYLPQSTICYDIEPDYDAVPQTIKSDFREVNLPYVPNSIVVGNPPFGRANKLSVQFVKKAMELGDYCAFIQPISQLNQNRTMKDTELLYSEDLGETFYSGKKIHCCFNVYHKKKNGHKQNFDIPGILECRHIFRSGKYKHKEELLNYQWDYRVAAWGSIRLLTDSETCPNEVVFRLDPNNPLIKTWLYRKLKDCDYKSLLSCVSTPNLPAWRLQKWLKEEYEKDNKL